MSGCTLVANGSVSSEPDPGVSTVDLNLLFGLYQEMQTYLGWESADAERIAGAKSTIEPAFGEIIDDFYAELARHPGASRVITGGEEQVLRLKKTLLAWLNDLFDGPYDLDFVARRFKVGYRHVEIGLSPFHTQAALARIRMRLQDKLVARWNGSVGEQHLAARSLNKLLDLDMNIIEYAYQSEFAAREQQQERLVTLGKVSAGIAHELRNPLNAVKTSVYFLLNAVNPSAEKTREHLERIDRQVGISDGVITALSRFAKLPVPNMQPIQLCDLVEQTLEVNPVPDNVELVTDPPEDAPLVAGDHEQLQIVLGNLIRNACEAMPDGGRLTLRGRTAPQNGDAPDRFTLTVSDTGCGMIPDILTRIMEPLFSTKTRGLGLGLALAQAITQRHDGELKVASELGEGTTFTLVLNLADDLKAP